MADLPALFADLVRLEIELWNAVEARLRAELGVGLATAQTLAVVAAVQDCRVHDIARDLRSPSAARARPSTASSATASSPAGRTRATAARQ